MSIETAAMAMQVFGSLGLILAVYTLCTRIQPVVVLAGLMILLVFAYLAVLTMFIFLSVGPLAFSLYVSVVYLGWNLWAHTPRLIGA